MSLEFTNKVTGAWKFFVGKGFLIMNYTQRANQISHLMQLWLFTSFKELVRVICRTYFIKLIIIFFHSFNVCRVCSNDYFPSVILGLCIYFTFFLRLSSQRFINVTDSFKERISGFVSVLYCLSTFYFIVFPIFYLKTIN